MVPTERLVVEILGGADRVVMVPPKFEATPAATQLAVVTHDTPERDPTPDGGAMVVQEAPPLVVLTMFVPPTAVHVDALMQLTEVKVVEPAGVPRSFHCEPPLSVPIAWDPVARQVVSVEHEMPSRAVPDGAVCGTQVPPPLVVLRIAAPGPPAEEPTAVQCVESTQEIPVKLLTVAGNVSDDHIVPPSVETMMLAAAAPESLTAWQIEMLTHETAVKMPTPDGIVPGVQVMPPSVVLIATGLRKMPNPTAVQRLVVAQEIPFNPLTWAGTTAALHAYPALIEVRTESAPAAKQSAVLGQETAFRLLVPGGGFCATHDIPPFVVPMMVDPAPMLPLFPTAMQSTAPEHETPVRLTALGGGI
jgi:hypothetical protein